MVGRLNQSTGEKNNQIYLALGLTPYAHDQSTQWVIHEKKVCSCIFVVIYESRRARHDMCDTCALGMLVDRRLDKKLKWTKGILDKIFDTVFVSSTSNFKILGWTSKRAIDKNLNSLICFKITFSWKLSVTARTSLLATFNDYNIIDPESGFFKKP